MIFVFLDQNLVKPNSSGSKNLSSPLLVRLRQIVKRKFKQDTSTTASVLKEPIVQAIIPIMPIKYEDNLNQDTPKLNFLEGHRSRDRHEKSRVMAKKSKVKRYSGQNINTSNQANIDAEERDEALRRLNAKLHLKCILNDMFNAFKQIKMNSSDEVGSVLN